MNINEKKAEYNEQCKKADFSNFFLVIAFSFQRGLLHTQKRTHTVVCQ